MEGKFKLGLCECLIMVRFRNRIRSCISFYRHFYIFGLHTASRLFLAILLNIESHELGNRNKINTNKSHVNLEKSNIHEEYFSSFSRTIYISAHLAVIESAEEEEIIKTLQTEHNVEIALIGIYEQKDQWVTIMDEPLGKTGYVHWRMGEPNNERGQEHCGSYMTNKHGSGLNDTSCKIPLPYICEIDLA